MPHRAQLRLLLLTALSTLFIAGRDVAWGHPAVPTALLVAVVALSLPVRRVPRLGAELVAWLLFLAWAALSLLWSRDPRTGVRVAAEWFGLLLLAASMWQAPRGVRRVVGRGALFAALLLALAWLASFGMWWDHPHFAYYARWPHHGFGARSAVAAWLLLGAGWVSGPVLLLVAASTSRGPLLGLLAGDGFRLARTRGRWAGRLVLWAMVGLAHAAALSTPAMAVRRGIITTANVRTASSGRTTIWSHAAALAGDHPLVGSGLGSFGARTTASREARAHADPDFLGGPDDPGPARGAHNVLLTLWVELGLLGLGLGMTALAWSARRLRRDPDRWPLATLAFLGAWGLSGDPALSAAADLALVVALTSPRADGPGDGAG